MKYWKVGDRVDTLSYYVYAPNEATAIKTVEALMGPQNPSQRVVRELPGCPEGYTLTGEDGKESETQMLDPVE